MRHTVIQQQQQQGAVSWGLMSEELSLLSTSVFPFIRVRSREWRLRGRTCGPRKQPLMLYKFMYLVGATLTIAVR